VADPAAAVLELDYCIAGEGATPPIDTTQPLSMRRGHGDGATASGVMHAQGSAAADYCFPRQPVASLASATATKRTPSKATTGRNRHERFRPE